MYVFHRTILLVFITLLVHGQFCSQYNEVVRTGRPGQAIGPYAVGANVFQLQSGIQYGQIDRDEVEQRYLEPGTVIRYGIGRSWEVNTFWAWRRQRTLNGDDGVTSSGVAASAIGFRTNLCDGHGDLPALGFQFSMKLPIRSDVGSDATGPNPRYILTASKKIAEQWGVLLNIGGDHNEWTTDPEWLYVVNVNYSINAKWSTFLENYATFGNGYSGHWDTGVSYLANNDLQWDIYGGGDANNGHTDLFMNLGLSYRFLTRHKQAP